MHFTNIISAFCYPILTIKRVALYIRFFSIRQRILLMGNEMLWGNKISVYRAS